jgi:hypothetical protein
LEARKARQEALQAGGARTEPVAPPLRDPRSEPVPTLLGRPYLPNPSREDPRTSPPAPLAKTPPATLTEEQELLRAAEEGLAKLRRLQGFQGFDRKVEDIPRGGAPQRGGSRSPERGGGSGKEEERLAAVATKVALERLLELQKSGLDPVDVAGRLEVQSGAERRAPGSPGDLWTGAAHGGKFWGLHRVCRVCSRFSRVCSGVLDLVWKNLGFWVEVIQVEMEHGFWDHKARGRFSFCTLLLIQKRKKRKKQVEK